jgi:hypothetical protein
MMASLKELNWLIFLRVIWRDTFVWPQNSYWLWPWHTKCLHSLLWCMYSILTTFKKQRMIRVKIFVLLSPCLKGQVMPTSLYLCHKCVLANIYISRTEWMKSPVPCNMIVSTGKFGVKYWHSECASFALQRIFVSRVFHWYWCVESIRRDSYGYFEKVYIH